MEIILSDIRCLHYRDTADDFLLLNELACSVCKKDDFSGLAPTAILALLWLHLHSNFSRSVVFTT